MKTLSAALLATLVAAAAPAAAQAPTDEKALYGLGMALADNLEVFSLTPAELEVVIKALREAAAHKPKYLRDEKLNAAINELGRSRKAAADEKQRAAGPEYLTRMALSKGAKKTASGAVVIPVKEGTGPSPTGSDKVKVHYAGRLIDGKEFDSSVKRGQPAEFPLDGVIKCWTEALQMMKVGGKSTVVCPSDIAYGPSGRPPVIPGNAVLTFEVELLETVK
jgi:FKBP-type peptidyl-prolyl cis-trans isomerase